MCVEFLYLGDSRPTSVKPPDLRPYALGLPTCKIMENGRVKGGKGKG